MTRSQHTSVHKNECAAVFHAVFGDTEEEIIEFYSITDMIPVDEKVGGVTVGIAHILPVRCGDLVGGYLYAVGVLPAYRGRGILDRLMKKCEQFCREQGYDFACLIPATDALSETYRRRGYLAEIATVCGIKKDRSEGVFCLSPPFIASVAMGKTENAPTFGLAKPLSGVPLPQNMHFPYPMGELL